MESLNPDSSAETITYLQKRVAELHDAVDIAVSHLEGITKSNQQHAYECAAHAHEVLSRVL